MRSAFEGDIGRVEWGKEIKFGIVSSRFTPVVNSRGQLLGKYRVVESSVAAFAGSRCVASNLTHDEASALCTILNAGDNTYE